MEFGGGPDFEISSYPHSSKYQGNHFQDTDTSKQHRNLLSTKENFCGEAEETLNTLQKLTQSPKLPGLYQHVPGWSQWDLNIISKVP